MAPYLTLLPEGAGQREHGLREVFNGLRNLQLGRPGAGCPTTGRPRRLSTSRRSEDPTAAALDSRTSRSSPESLAWAGYDGANCKKGSKLHMAVDILGHLPAAHVTPATADDRAQVGQLTQVVQVATGERVDLAYVDHGHADEKAAAAQERGIG